MSVSISSFLLIAAVIVAAVGIKKLLGAASAGKHAYDDFITRRNSISMICFAAAIASVSFFLLLG